MSDSQARAGFQLCRWVSRLGWSVVAAGLLLHFTVRDRVPFVAVLYYALPLPVLGGLAVALALFAWKRRAVITALGAGAAILALWWFISWRSGPEPLAFQPIPAQEVKVLLWNVARPEGLFDPLLQLVRDHQPHLVGVVEPGIWAMNHPQDYQQALPGYDVQVMPRGLILMNRIPARMRGRGKLDGLGAFAVFEVTGAGRPAFRVVLADVYATPWISRRRSIEEVMDHGQNDVGAVLMGDFNTPLDSAFFDPYRQRMQHAFTVGGQGLTETWPFGVPLLGLDHIWVGPAWHVIETRKIQKLASDHAALLVRMVPE